MNFKNPFAKLFGIAAFTGASLLANAEKPAENSVKEKEENKMELVHQESETTAEIPSNLPGIEPNPEPLDLNAERAMQIKKIQTELSKWNTELKAAEDTLGHAVKDFETEYSKVLKSMGEQAPARPVIDDEKGELDFQEHINSLIKKMKKPGYKVKPGDVFYLPQFLKRLVSEISGKYITTQNITSQHSVESLKGILLGQGSPVESQIIYLNMIMNQSLNGSGEFTSTGDAAVETFDGTAPVVVTRNQFRKDEAHGAPGLVPEGLGPRAALGAAPGEIIKQMLHVEKANHEIDELQAKMNALMNVPAGPSDIASDDTPRVDL